MSEFGLVKDKTSLQFEDHLTSLRGDVRKMLLELRGFVMSLGDMVIEEVRPHRIVYAKTLNFRAFLDVQPKGDGLMIVVKYGRSKSENALLICSDKDLEMAKSLISQAFQDIR
jgi:predicted transport protein